MMHIPKMKMSCWTAEATPRPWLWMDRYRINRFRPDAIDPSISCRAWDRDAGDRERINGDSCDGCARIKQVDTSSHNG